MGQMGNMVDGLEALVALERCGTVSEAAVRLRLTQSAVSKRLAALQRAVGQTLLRPQGRRVVLTPEGLQLLEQGRPLLAGLRELGVATVPESVTTFSLGLADSIAASWGPRLVASALEELPQVRVQLHAHRSVLLVERVRLGRYQAGLSTQVGAGPELLQHRLLEEPMVMVHGLPVSASTPLISIEASSATWGAIEPQLRRHHPALLQGPITPVETFSAALQMVRAGFGRGLVPLGLALQAGLGQGEYVALEGVRRPINLVARKTVHHMQRFAQLRDALERAAARVFEPER